MNFTKSLIMTSSILTALTFSNLAQAESVVLCSGSEGGGYDAVMKGVATQLRNRNIQVEIINTNGSEEVLDALDSGRCNYGPAQKDIHYLLSKENAGMMTSVVPASILYNEVMTMVCSKSSGYDELDDVNEGDKIIVGPVGSGSARSWENIVAIENEFGNGSAWSKAVPVYSDLDESEATLALGTAKCAFGVGKVPSSWAKDMENTNTLSWIEDKDINDLEVNNESLYTSVRVDKGSYNSKFDTYVVPAILFRSASAANKPSKNTDKLVKKFTLSIGRQFETVE